MTEPERKILDRTFDSPPVPGHGPWWARGATPIIVLVVLVAFVLSLLAMALF
jgi:flagellin-like protein